MWYTDYQNKTLNLCMLNSFKGFHLRIKKAILWYLENQLMKKTRFAHVTASKQKHPLQESHKNTKYVLVI